MKTGAEIVKIFEAHWQTIPEKIDHINEFWPTIRAALLAYEPPKSALRTILDRCYLGPQTFSADEIEAARAELDKLEAKQ